MPLRLVVRLLTLEALRALGRNKLRSGLAMLGISVAVATVIIVVAIGRAGVQAAEHDLDMLGDNLVWVEAGSRTVNGARSGTHGMTTLTAKDAQAIREEVPKIALVSEQVDGSVLVANGEHNWLSRFRGVSPAYQQIKRWEMADGEYFTQDHVDHAARVLVIGETVRHQLFGDERAVGEIIRAGDSLYEVIGVLAPKGTSATGQDQDDTVMLPWTTARDRLIGKDQTWLDDILCSAVSADQIKPAGTQIAELLRERHHIAPGADDDFNIRHPEELLQARIKSSRTLQALFLIIASISMAVGGIGVMNVMLASVSQRITEIGVRAAVGARPAAIRLQFLAEAVMLTTIGGALGLVIGEVATHLLETNLGWTLAMSSEIRVAAVGSAIAMGVVFGYYPASRAAQLDPIAALARE
jgi:putative ABC transport system permease protein